MSSADLAVYETAWRWQIDRFVEQKAHRVLIHVYVELLAQTCQQLLLFLHPSYLLLALER